MHWTEEDVITMIRRHFPARPEVAPHGIGDDCAIIRSHQTLITTDASVEGVHFDLSWMTAADAAYRCTASNISDVAAMGAYAGPFTLAACLPPDMQFAEIEDIVRAIRQCIADHNLPNCWLIGGDVVRSKQLMFSITMLGEMPPWPVVRRDGARGGDMIYVAGNPGFSAAGLDIFQHNLHHNPDIADRFAPLLQAFRRPQALAQFGPDAAQNCLPTAMMDLSDGIYTDLPRLLKQSRCGAVIEIDRLPLNPILAQLSALIPNADAVAWTLFGGEDFGLLMTVSPDNADKLKMIAEKHHLPLFFIGICTDEPEIKWIENGKISHRINKSFMHF